MALLGGLEVTVLSLSELFSDNTTLRLDSEYNKKEYIRVFKDLFKSKTEKVKDLTNWVTQGPNPTFNEDGEIPCLTGRNISKGTINYNNPDFVDSVEYEKLKRFQIKKGDTLITLKGKGSIGKIGYVTNERKAIFSRNIGIMRPNKIDAGYLNAFILSSYGLKIIERGETGGTGQSTLTTEYLKNIDIARLSIESEIGYLVEMSEEILLSSQETYRKAEESLLQSLNFEDFKPSQSPTNIKNLSKSFGISGRLDAEYYQVKYENYISLINSYSGGSDSFGNVCTLKDKNFAPLDKLEYKYIELSNIGKAGDITGCTVALGAELPTRARRKVSTGDVVISSIEGSLDSCALITEEYKGALCSTGFYVANSKKINSETLLVLFKSAPMQAIFKKCCSGTILTAFSRTELDMIPIPLIDSEIQEKIKKQVNESFQLKKLSEHLLEVAKRAVEIAIEEDEEAALGYIEEETASNSL